MSVLAVLAGLLTKQHVKLAVALVQILLAFHPGGNAPINVVGYFVEIGHLVQHGGGVFRWPY